MRKILAVLTLASIGAGLGYSMREAWKQSEERRRNYSESALVLQEPKMSFPEAYQDYLLEILEQIEGNGRTAHDSWHYNRQVSALLDKISGINMGDTDKIDDLANLIRSTRERRIKERAAKALGRIENEAKDAMYSLIAEPARYDGDVQTAAIVAEELTKLDPSAAAQAIVKSERTRFNDTRSSYIVTDPFDDLTRALIKTGDETALSYYIENRDARALAAFVNYNDKAPFLQQYNWTIIRIIVQEGMELPSGSLRCLDWRTLHGYGSAIRILDKYYAEGALASEFERRLRSECVGAWMKSDLDPGEMFLRGLRGQ